MKVRLDEMLIDLRRPLAVLALVACAIAPVTAAADTASEKAGRGFAAITTGFLEVPGNIKRETDRHGAAYGVPVGFVKGLGGIVVRELVGVYEVVTAPFAVPYGYEPIIEPEYPWGYFESGEYVADERHPRSVGPRG